MKDGGWRMEDGGWRMVSKIEDQRLRIEDWGLRIDNRELEISFQPTLIPTRDGQVFIKIIFGANSIIFGTGAAAFRLQIFLQSLIWRF